MFEMKVLLHAPVLLFKCVCVRRFNVLKSIIELTLRFICNFILLCSSFFFFFCLINLYDCFEYRNYERKVQGCARYVSCHCLLLYCDL